MTMRRSPRRPLILRRRKLPFQQNDPPAAESQSQAEAPGFKEPSKSVASQCFPDGIRIMDHPSMSDTQVVVIPKTADLQSVIGALTAKGKECGVQGPNKFILLSGNGSRDNGSFCQPAAEGDDVTAVGQPVKEESVDSSPDAKPLTGIKALNKELECGPLDDSLTNIQWLGKMNTCTFETDAAKQMADKENVNSDSQAQSALIDAEAVQQPMSERPPYSYMAMIQFAINSRKSRRMTLKEIYMWIEDHFPYFREVAKPGWKNSIRHNLSLHDMFIRETSPDGKISFWTIRPEANRCLTLDQVYKPGCDPMTAPVPVPQLLFPNQQQKRMLPDSRKTPTSSERRMKPLLPRTDSYLVPIQLPVTSSVFLPSSLAQFPPSCSQQKRNTSRGAKRVRIAPKVTQSDVPAVVVFPQKDNNVTVKEEQECVPIKCETPKAPPTRQASSSRRKQRLVHSVNEEPVLLCPDNTFFDSGVVSDASTFQEMRDTELDEHQQEQRSPDRDFSFKTPIKSNNHLTSSTPSKPPSHVVPEPWKVTPVGKGSQSVLDFSPIRTPGGPAVTPRHDYTTFSFNSTPFKDWPLFSSPRELLTSAPARATGPTDSPIECLRSSCSRELLQAGGAAATPANRSITEGLVLDTMNDSLSKILVDISFSGLDDEDLGMANLSWSEFLPQFK
ncbi:forkhead box protein M1 [Anoplopoma fimbria]|uniref:forkhead box protein M1 n=1 Tax=Anoplopoma fimbria TaxID=229290 RepID=UPI0023EBD139|nr:forkhead box protein M1 [Anoplopoma fimbria]XP_054480414.1 forkhead box protein M1 [Anoplopoma fimbria]